MKKPAFGFIPQRSCLALKKRLSRADLVVTHPAGHVAAVSYEAYRMASPRILVVGEKIVAEQVRIASSLAGIPVLTWPLLAARLTSWSREGAPASPFCWRPLARAFAYVHGLDPHRYTRKWRLAAPEGPIARTLLRRWMLEAVSRADFVITGSDNTAIALQYDHNQEGMHAPIVLAMGNDRNARAIEEVAVTHGVPLIEHDICAKLLDGKARACDFVPADHWGEVIDVMRTLFPLHRRRFRRWFDKGELQNTDEGNEGEEWKKGTPQ